MRLTFDQLRVFVTVAEERHFGRAAERLSMTQPPLSRQLQRLESTIGARLVIRSSRVVHLTAAGDALLPRARQILGLTESAPELARRAADGSHGRLLVGFTATAALSLAGQLLREADAALPDVDIVIKELVSSVQLARLSAGRLDLAFARPATELPDSLESRLVRSEKLVAAIPSSHPLGSTGSPLSRDLLEGCEFINYTPRAARYFRDLVTGGLSGVKVHETQRVTNIHSMLTLVASRRGIALVPESAQALRVRGVNFRSLTNWPDNRVELYAVWSRDSMNPALRLALSSLPSLRAAQRS